MTSLEEIKKARLEKLELLRKAGMDPYPAKVPRSMCLLDTRANFEEFSKQNKIHSIVGRVMAIRGQGAIFFVVLDDGKAKFQAVFKKDSIDEKLLKLFNDTVDIGDFISVTGKLAPTQKGEPSLFAQTWTMASKSLLPLPEKWHGLQDEEEKLRKRYLDMLMNPELRDVFVKKAKFWDATRTFLKKEGFLEVETPTLELTTGGAEARPFKTHHNDFDIDVFLRISVGELWQKRLMAGGFQKTFEIGRAYRNEGSSPDHAQEFTNFESYWAYANYKDAMDLYEKMIKQVAFETFGTYKFKAKGFSFDLEQKWEIVEYVPTVKKITGIDILSATEKEMQTKLRELGVKYDGLTKERLADSLWKYCRKQISGPAWLINHPKLISPLAKTLKENPELTERFQLILAGTEGANGYTELNDPIDQRARFEEQQKLIDRGDDEAMMPEWDFVEMLEHGMPPTCGFAYGERLFTLLCDKPLRETQMFPLVKPKIEKKVVETKEVPKKKKK